MKHLPLLSVQAFLLVLNMTTVTQGLTSESSIVKKVAVVGSTGQLGRRAVAQLLDRKIPVKCMIRQSTPPDFLLKEQTRHPELMEFVTGGDVTDPVKVKELLKDCSHCLALHGATRRSKWYEPFIAAEGSEDSDPSHAKQVNYESMKTFVECAQDTDCEHIVRITGKGEEPFSFFSVLINGLGSMAKGWNYEGEQVLRGQPTADKQKHLDYTIVRPGIMKSDFDPVDSDVHLKLVDNGGDLMVSAVTYDQIAELCIESLLQPLARDTTLTAMNVAGKGPSIANQLKLVQRDTRDFPKSLIEEHKRAVKLVFRSFAAAILAVVTGVLFRFLL
jgi:NAD(P)H-binding